MAEEYNSKQKRILRDMTRMISILYIARENIKREQLRDLVLAYVGGVRQGLMAAGMPQDAAETLCKPLLVDVEVVNLDDENND